MPTGLMPRPIFLHAILTVSRLTSGDDLKFSIHQFFLYPHHPSLRRFRPLGHSPLSPLLRSLPVSAAATRSSPGAYGGNHLGRAQLPHLPVSPGVRFVHSRILLPSSFVCGYVARIFVWIGDLLLLYV